MISNSESPGCACGSWPRKSAPTGVWKATAHTHSATANASRIPRVLRAPMSHPKTEGNWKSSFRAAAARGESSSAPQRPTPRSNPHRALGPTSVAHKSPTAIKREGQVASHGLRARAEEDWTTAATAKAPQAAIAKYKSAAPLLLSRPLDPRGHGTISMRSTPSSQPSIAAEPTLPRPVKDTQRAKAWAPACTPAANSAQQPTLTKAARTWLASECERRVAQAGISPLQTHQPSIRSELWSVVQSAYGELSHMPEVLQGSASYGNDLSV